MQSLFKMPPHEEDVLFILGNGFDVSHGIKSRYNDFKDWVLLQRNQRLIELMNIFFSNERELWSDIETALGEYNEEAILEFCHSIDDIDYDHMMRSVAAIEDAPDWIFKPIVEEFFESFNQWVESIDISQAKIKHELFVGSKYLTFNYLETLEEVYKIPSQQIVHIHGSRDINNRKYIMGHSSWKDPNLHDTLSGGLYFKQDTKNKIIRWMNELKKDTDCIIKNHSPFFNSLTNINTVVVKGHSLSKVDWPYFEEVAKRVSPNSRWILYYFSKGDLANIQELIVHLKLTKTECLSV